MANYFYSLSTKRRGDGRVQVLAKVTINRTLAFRVKSSVFVSPGLWDADNQRVTIPKRGRLNSTLVNEAQAQHAAFNAFTTDLVAIIASAQDIGTTPSKEWVETALKVKPILVDPRNNFCPDHAGRLYTTENLARALQIAESSKAKEITTLADKENLHLPELCHLYCQRNNISANRTKTYHSLARQIGRYETFMQLTEPRRRKGFKLSSDTLTTDDIEAFRDYLRNESELAKEYPKIFAEILKRYPVSANEKVKRTIQPRGENTIIGQMKRFQAVMNWCYSTGKTQNKPFETVTIGAELYGTPTYITRDERNAIADADLSAYSKSMQTQRDIFVFQCLTGCRVGDLYSLTNANIDESNVLRYTPSKTQGKSGATATIPLSERAISILDKYKGIDKQGRLLPFISEQQYDKSIKAIFRACGIIRDVVTLNPTTRQREVRCIADIASSHMARRIFIGAAYQKVKDPNIIGKMSGHTEGSRAFARYRAIDENMLREVIDQIQ